jgi:hypothetical protein
VLLSAPDVGPKHSVFLEQAAHLTGGLHTHPRPEDHASLLAYLAFLYLGGTAERQRLLLPPAQSVDLRAHCFCHRQHQTVAWVCTVCLSIFCKYSEVCATCGAKAPPPPLTAAAAAVGAVAVVPASHAPGAGVAGGGFVPGPTLGAVVADDGVS